MSIHLERHKLALTPALSRWQEREKADWRSGGGLHSVEVRGGLAPVLILDGRTQVAYTRTNHAPPVSYVHNCLGAVFVPDDLQMLGGENLVARVAPGSPASKAGIRDGDVLLGWNDVDVSAWRTQPNVIPSFRYSSNQPPAQLTLKRGMNTYFLRVEPKPILVPKDGD